MMLNSYKPKELLESLLEIETKLEETINKFSFSEDVPFEGNLDQAIDKFLNNSESSEKEVAYSFSQLSMLLLRKEFEKVKGAIVEVNNLKAVYDYKKYIEVNSSSLL